MSKLSEFIEKTRNKLIEKIFLKPIRAYVNSHWQSWVAKVGAMATGVLIGAKVKPYLDMVGVTVDEMQLQIAIAGLLEYGRMWVTHQKWTPDILKKVL